MVILLIAHIYINIHVYIRTYVYICMHICVYLYICMHVRMYACRELAILKHCYHIRLLTKSPMDIS